MKKLVCVIFSMLIFFACGCATNQPAVIPHVIDSIDLSSATRTSEGIISETADGYYTDIGNVLVYADKSNLQKWIPVCNLPNCDHYSDDCTANTLYHYIKDDRIYTVRFAYTLNPNGKDHYAVYSMAYDGTDSKLECYIDGSNMDGGGFAKFLCHPGKFYMYSSIMQTDGYYKNVFSVTDSKQTSIIAQSTSVDVQVCHWIAPAKMWGDTVILPEVMSADTESEDSLFRITASGIEELKSIRQYDLSGSYLSGNDLFRFDSDKGYFYTELATGKSQKWMEPQIEKSKAYILSPQWIVETNLLYQQTPAVPHMRVYNGTDWTVVTLPTEILPDPGELLVPLALTTEHIFFQSRKAGENCLYVVNHADSNPILTLCGQF